MGVGLVFLRPREDGTWEGDYLLRGWGEFGEIQEQYLAHGGLLFLSGREDEYDIDVDKKGPPHPATVSKDLARELLEWIKVWRPEALRVLRQIPDEEIESYAHNLKRLIEQYLEEGYAFLISL